MSHTPGPWEVFETIPERERPGIETADNAGSIVVFGLRGQGDDAGVWGRTPDEELANARLIAAAPDLLDALIAFVDAAERGATNFFDMKGSCLRKARAAIAKAEGHA